MSALCYQTQEVTTRASRHVGVIVTRDTTSPDLREWILNTSLETCYSEHDMQRVYVVQNDTKRKRIPLVNHLVVARTRPSRLQGLTYCSPQNLLLEGQGPTRLRSQES